MRQTAFAFFTSFTLFTFFTFAVDGCMAGYNIDLAMSTPKNPITTSLAAALSPLLEMDVTKLAEFAKLRKDRDAQVAKVNAEQTKLDELDKQLLSILPESLTKRLLHGEGTPLNGSAHTGDKAVRGQVQGAILTALTGHEKGLKIAEIVEKSGLPRAKVESWLFSRSGKAHTEKVEQGVYKMKTEGSQSRGSKPAAASK